MRNRLGMMLMLILVYGISLSFTIIVSGEAGGSILGTRAHIEKLWHGARVVDHHGMTEIGPVSYGCPARPGVLHVIESAFFAEIIEGARPRVWRR